MPVRGTCLLYDTPLKEALFDAVELIAYDRLSSGQGGSIGSVYKALRDSGIEVDLPTVGEIYLSVLPKDDANFSSETEVEDYVGRSYRDAINTLVELNTLVGEKQIKDQKPETAVVEMLTSALYDNLVEDQRTTSDMKKLQDALWKGMQRMLGTMDSKKPTKRDMADLIDESLGWERMGVEDVNGQLNSIEDLFNAMRAELARASDDIRESDADPAIIDRYNEYVKNLENATYQLLFRRPDAVQVRNEALINAGFGKTINGRTQLDWDKLAADIGSVADIRSNADAAFLAAGYSQEVTDRLKDTLQQEFEDLRATIVEKQLQGSDRFAQRGEKRVFGDAGYESLLAGRTEAQWIKDQQVEDVETLHAKVDQSLADKKYVPLVVNKIKQRITDFFNRNYARVATLEAKTAIDDILGDQTTLQWIKSNGIQNQDELYQALDAALEGRDIEESNKQLIRDEFKRILDIDTRAENELAGREERTEKPYRPKKSDIKKLIELYHLGIFNRRHDDLLYRLVGVDSLQRDDIADLEILANVASDLSRKIATPVADGGYGLGDDVFASREFQNIQRMVDRIVQRNVNNKNKLMKVLSFISNYLNVMLSGLLSLPRTIVQNVLSGVKAVASGIRFGPSEGGGQRTKQAWQVWKAMLKDVTRTGQAYGEEIGSFATQELYLNTLRIKFGKGATPSEIAKSVLAAGTAHIRLGLLAFDSANKVALTNKVFYNIVYNSILKTFGSGVTPLEVTKYMNEALYGQSFQDAKVLARKIAERRNDLLPAKFKDKITDAYVTTLANDIVKANLNTGGLIPAGTLEAALKGSYHVAGLGLGHDPNNFFSRAIKTYRDNLRSDERKLITEKDWSALALHRTKAIFMNNFVIQFAGGATNWMWLRAKEGLGLGLYHLIPTPNSKWKSEIDFSNEQTVKRQVIEREKQRNDIARALIGMSYSAVFYAAGFGLTIGGDDDEDELKKLNAKRNKTDKDRAKIEEIQNRSSVYRSIKQNREKDQWFRTLAPDVQLIAYYQANSQTGGLGEGLLKYAERTYAGNDQFSVTGKMRSAGQSFRSGDNDAGYGILTSIVGDKFQVPLWKGFKEYYRIATNPFRDEKIPPAPYYPPTNWQNGLWGGGFLQDMGVYNGKISITAMPGVGPKSYEKFKSRGIDSMNDLADHPNWPTMKDKNGKYILDADDRFKAKKFYEKYKKEKSIN